MRKLFGINPHDPSGPNLLTCAAVINLNNKFWASPGGERHRRAYPDHLMGKGIPS
jgi:hypothetical protein